MFDLNTLNSPKLSRLEVLDISAKNAPVKTQDIGRGREVDFGCFALEGCEEECVNSEREEARFLRCVERGWRFGRRYERLDSGRIGYVHDAVVIELLDVVPDFDAELDGK